MIIGFRSKKLQKLCCSSKKMMSELGKPNADKLKQRFAELDAADTLADLRFLPGLRCHELGGNRKGQLAVDLAHPYRLVFIPEHNPLPKKTDGGLDWEKVKRIQIIEVIDYH